MFDSLSIHPLQHPLLLSAKQSRKIEPDKKLESLLSAEL